MPMEKCVPYDIDVMKDNHLLSLIFSDVVDDDENYINCTIFPNIPIVEARNPILVRLTQLEERQNCQKKSIPSLYEPI